MIKETFNAAFDAMAVQLAEMRKENPKAWQFWPDFKNATL